MIAEIIKKTIQNALDELSLEADSIHLEHPTDLVNGDYSTNVAMALAKKEGKNPQDLARQIADKILEDKPSEIEKVEVAGNGFINFYLSQEFFSGSINEILKSGEKWGSNEILKNQKTIVEYTDPNPFKEFHIGHLMSNAVGESISRLVEFSGAIVRRANYQGDVGLHVAKAIWANTSGMEIYDNNLSLEKRMEYWGRMYADGDMYYRNDNKSKVNIQEVNRQIYEKSNPIINEKYKIGRKDSLDYFEEIYKKLGTKFDEYFFESETGPVGKKLVEENIGKVFEESDGAIIFKGEKYGLHTRVFINSEGLPTYEAKDLGLAKIKSDRYDYDKSIVITASEQKEYYKVVLEAMKQIFPELAEKTKHITHGMLRLPSGKMSSRTGDVITGESLIGEVKERVLDKMKDSEIENKAKATSGSLKEEIAEQIAVGAIKYSILKQSAGKDIIFDFDKSLSFEGDSGPYLQYSHTRASSILEKAQKQNIQFSEVKPPKIWAGELEKLLYRFPEVVERANKEFEPHYVTTYLTELAGAFNSFYAKERILDDVENAPYKLALTQAFQTTMKNGLWLLGIIAPERM